MAYKYNVILFIY